MAEERKMLVLRCLLRIGQGSLQDVVERAIVLGMTVSPPLTREEITTVLTMKVQDCFGIKEIKPMKKSKIFSEEKRKSFHSLLDLAMLEVGKLIRSSCPDQELYWIGFNRGLMEIYDYVKYDDLLSDPAYLARRRLAIQSFENDCGEKHLKGFQDGFDAGVTMLKTGTLTVPKGK